MMGNTEKSRARIMYDGKYSQISFPIMYDGKYSQIS